MIEVKNLTKKFGDFVAVDAVSFTVEEGKTIALIGTSGSGKTTTLKMINRLIDPTSGLILVNGQNIMEQQLETMRRGMGYVIQNMGLFPHYKVFDNVALVPRLLNWKETDIQKRVFELLEKLRLDPAENTEKFPRQLSGGQQQRVGIARALAANPPIILMDEPFGALDPITRQEVRAEFKELEELKSKTTLIVTHDIEEAFEMADLICLLDQGKIQQLGSPDDLLFHPANQFVEDFIGDQRLGLEFSILQLSEVLEHLPSEGEQIVGAIAAKLSIREAMAQLSAKAKKAERLQIEATDRAFNLPELMIAFQKTKSNK